MQKKSQLPFHIQKRRDRKKPWIIQHITHDNLLFITKYKNLNTAFI